MWGVRLMLQHPDIASRACEYCIQYVHEDKPGHFGEVVIHRDKPLPRLKGMKPPCHWCEKIPEGEKPIPENAAELSAQNFQAFQHYLECKAVGSFPNDAIVRRNAAIIRRVEDAAERVHDARGGLITLGMILGGGKGK